MRDYEVVYIFDPSLGESDVQARLDRFHGVVTEPDGAEVTALDHWGVRQLAYPIQKQRTGYYVVAQFHTDPSLLGEFERRIKLDDHVMRHLMVLHEGQPTSGRSILAEEATAGTAEKPEGAGTVPAGGVDEDVDEEEELEEVEPEEEQPGRGQASPPEFSGGRGQRRRVEGPVIEVLNYKDVDLLSRFITEQGKILPRRTTKVSAQFQRHLGRAVKRARHLALMPYVPDHEG